MEVVAKAQRPLEHLRSSVKNCNRQFGTGYSSLNYLMNHNVNRLKVRQDLVFRITAIPECRGGASGNWSGARLAIEVIAEGGGDGSSCELPDLAGCELAQGSYFSRPGGCGTHDRAASLRIIDPAEISLRSQSGAA